MSRIDNEHKIDSAVCISPRQETASMKKMLLITNEKTHADLEVIGM